jgi:hypothetical protein
VGYEQEARGDQYSETIFLATYTIKPGNLNENNRGGAGPQTVTICCKFKQVSFKTKLFFGLSSLNSTFFGPPFTIYESGLAGAWPLAPHIFMV